MISIDEARTRVARGAAHLDTVRPGWHDRIDVGTLTLHDPCGCVLGQLCGTRWWTDWTVVFDMTDEQIEAYGFDITESDDDNYDENIDAVEVFAQLQDAWIEAIADRRLKAAAIPVHDPVTV